MYFRDASTSRGKVNICFSYLTKILTLFWIEEDPVCLVSTVKEKETHRKTSEILVKFPNLVQLSSI